MTSWAPGLRNSIRVRLGAGLALALAPVLVLGALQAVIDYRRNVDAVRVELALAAERSADTARTRMTSAAVLLETLAPEAVGLDCAPRLAEIARRIPEYENLVRFDATGRVACAAADVAGDPGRRTDPWFARLAAGESQLITRAPASLSPQGPALMAAERVADDQGRFQGAAVAVVSLASLRPDLADRSSSHTRVSLLDEAGRYLVGAGAQGLPPPPDFAAKARQRGSVVFYGRDAKGRREVASVAPLVGDVFVAITAPVLDLPPWERLNPLSSLVLPLLAFVLALVAVWFVAERVVIRWLVYLERIATIYARGRLSVRPLKADNAPSEIRQLAQTLETMAQAIDARDGSLVASLEEKDALMREIHHRVKNNLQVISSLISMQQRALTDPAARVAMSETRQRVSALALIYRALYQGPDLKRVNVRLFLEELIGQLVMEQQTEGRLVRTELEAQELIIDPDKLAPFALFAVEAISNAQKHALATNGGVLRVEFIIKGEKAELSVVDEGGGAPPVLTNGGVGRTLMAAFARQLRGGMELASNSHGGVTATLWFPTPAAETPEDEPVSGAVPAKGRRRRAA